MATSPHRAVLRSVDAPLEATVIYGRGGGRAPGPAQPPRLVVVSGRRAGVVVALAGDELTVGRAWDNDVVLPDISVSRRHALLRRDGAGYLLLDQGSGNGTRVNGRGVDKARLRSGDEIVLGDSVVQFIEAGGTAVRGTVAAARAPGAAAWRRALLRSRGAVYAGIAALLLAATALGLWRRQERERAAQEPSEQRAQIRAHARQPFDQGTSLLDERRSEAAGKPKLAVELDPQQPGVQAVLERAGAAASRVAADPARPDALELKAALSGQHRQAPPTRRARRAPPALPWIAEAFLAGDLAAALERARAARGESAAAALLARLERFASAWREGMARMQEDRSAEAIAALEQADQADRALAGGRDSPLGREVRRALSGLHTRMALAHTSDEEIGVAAAHLRAALARDPGNEEVRDQLGRLAARANEAYLSGYVAKDRDPDAARRAFRLAVAVLPATDETAMKARRWLDRLDGKAGAED